MSDSPNSELDSELRRALRPADPGDEFTRAVMARVSAQGTTAARQPFKTPSTHVLRWLPAALAASLLMMIVIKHEPHEASFANGQLAREQLLEALRVTSKKLDIAYQVVHNQSNAADDTGA
jgi:hypothetical protein